MIVFDSCTATYDNGNYVIDNILEMFEPLTFKIEPEYHFQLKEPVTYSNFFVFD